MRENEVPGKTDAGRDEIQNRSRKLPIVMRSILLLVDGQRTVAQLRQIVTGLHAPADALQQLADMGLIQSTEAIAEVPRSDPAVPARSDAANRFSLLYALMSDAIREHLGIRGYFVQLKIERCNNADDLLALLPEVAAAVGKAQGIGRDVEFEQRLRALAQA